ncbi:MAG: DUF1684 domain-containing protein [Bacteroidota bacterium]
MLLELARTLRFRTALRFGIVVSYGLLLIMVGCAKRAGNFDLNAYRTEIEKWKEPRLTGLTRDDGWLTLCGFFWLKEGENRFGTDSSNQIIFPIGKAPKVAGSLWLENGVVQVKVQKGAKVTSNGQPVTSMVLLSDEDGLKDPTVLNIGTLSFYLIKRGGQLAVRVKDKENPPRVNFRGLEYFPVDPKWRVEATYEPYNPPKMLQIATMINTVESDSCPGALAFELDGKTYRLDVIIERGTESNLFIMFEDSTNGKETYSLGRQLYTEMPDANGEVILDFNKAYNWPCVFTEFATCPIPPKQNHLPFRVEAGEKMYGGRQH